MQDGALDHALKAQRGLGFHFIGARYQRRVLFDEFGQVLAQLIQVAPQARNTSAAEGLSSMASNRCSTLMNSWRF